MLADDAYHDHFRDAVEHHAARYVVGFVFGLDSQSPQNLDMATGVALSWKDKNIVLTAAHVFTGTTRPRVVLPMDHPFERDGTPTVRVGPHRTTEASIPDDCAIVRSNVDDLCYFEVGRGFGESSDLQFYEMPYFAKTPKPGTLCLMMGFPRDLSQVVSNTEAVLNVAGRWSQRVLAGKNASFLRPFKPRSHFLMRFGKADKGRSAIGFSGAGIWFPVKDPKAPLWSPRLGLAGIQSHWYEPRLLTQVVRVERVIRFLSKQFG